VVGVEKDEERYPLEDDPEYADYRYKPQPWPLHQRRLPSKKVWNFMNQVDRCGTSTQLNQELPLYLNGSIVSGHRRGFGMYFEEKYSVWGIVFLSFIVSMPIMAPLAWIAKDWLDKHPDDLQGAFVPFMLGLSVLVPLLNFYASLLAFKTAVK
jgi:hypothetical protein